MNKHAKKQGIFFGGRGKAKKALAVLLTFAIIVDPVCRPTAVVHAMAADGVFGENAETAPAAEKADGTDILSEEENPAGEASEEALSQESRITVMDETAYDVVFYLDNQWNDQFQATITVTNTSAEKITGWNLKFSLNHQIDQIWNASVTEQIDNLYEIQNAGWNADIEAGESISFSFIAQWDNVVIETPAYYEMYTVAEKIEAVDCSLALEIVNDWVLFCKLNDATNITLNEAASA